jgi:hypothetical protein
MPGRLMHDFRRTAVRNLERAGVPHSVAMKLTGHKADAVFQRYAVAPERDLAEAMTKLVALARRLGPSFPSLPLAEQSNSPQSVQKKGLDSGGSRAPKLLGQTECPRRESNSHGVAPGGF